MLNDHDVLTVTYSVLVILEKKMEKIILVGTNSEDGNSAAEEPLQQTTTRLLPDTRVQVLSADVSLPSLQQKDGLVENFQGLLPPVADKARLRCELAEDGSVIMIRDDEASGLDSVGTTRYQLVVLLEDLPKILDPRDTLASVCFSKPASAVLWKVFTNPLITTVSLLMYLTGAVCALLSILGVYPFMGYYVLLIYPVTILGPLHFSTAKCKVIIKSFPFWSLTVLLIIGWGGMAAAVAHDVARLFAVAGACLSSLSLPLFDARLPTKRKSRAMFFSFTCTACFNWLLIGLWYTGSWQDTNQTIFQVVDITVDIQSISMSAMTTFAVIMTKFAWSEWFTEEVNPGVMLHADIAYRVILSNPTTLLAASPTTSLV